MTTISNQMNLNSHYSNSNKVERPQNVVVNTTTTIPKTHSFNDNDANKRFDIINKELKTNIKNEKDKTGKRFLAIFSAVVMTILAILGIKRIFK